MTNEKAQVQVVADTSGFDSALNSLIDSTRQFGKVFSTTIAGAIRSGKGFDNFLKDLARRFADTALSSAIKPIESLIGNLGTSLTSAVSGGFGTTPTGFSKGGVIPSGKLVPFAKGGVVSSPTLFGFGEKTGLMGEAGPEAILPLRRGSDGKLGIANYSQQTPSTHVVFNVRANDVESFRRSEGQISSMLARVVRNGQRGL